MQSNHGYKADLDIFQVGRCHGQVAVVRRLPGSLDDAATPPHKTQANGDIGGNWSEIAGSDHNSRRPSKGDPCRFPTVHLKGKLIDSRWQIDRRAQKDK